VATLAVDGPPQTSRSWGWLRMRTRTLSVTPVMGGVGMDVSVFDVIGDFAIALATAALTAVGAWLAHSYRRRMRFELAEARRVAYSELWEITGLAAPTRLDLRGISGCLTSSERQTLYQAMTDWYYRNGNGMLLESTTRTVYLNAKHNLVCARNRFKPQEAWVHIKRDLRMDEECVRGVLSIRHLSLLRTQLKSDLAIFGQPFKEELASHERLFLEKCGVDLRARPWSSASPSGKEEVVRQAEVDQPLILPTVVLNVNRAPLRGATLTRVWSWLWNVPRHETHRRVGARGGVLGR
jgi:hypothetical protein